MHGNEFQKKAHTFASYNNDQMYPILLLGEEAGEVQGKFAKAIRDDFGDITEERKEAIILELGDCLWAIAEIAINLGYDLETVMERNIKKLTDRKERGVINGSGDCR